MTQQKKKYIDFRNPRTGKKVGYVVGNGKKKMYVSERGEDHIFRKFCGFGVSHDVLAELEKKQIDRVCILYKPTGEALCTKRENFGNCSAYSDGPEDIQNVMSMWEFFKPEGIKLFKKLIKTLKRFVSVKEEEYHLLALWIMHTYAVKEFGVTPYIQLTGQAGSGKSTIMRVCSKLVRNGKTGSFSEASVYRMLKDEVPTLFFNEFEDIKDRKFMIEVLNNGYEEGQTMSKVVDNEVVEFSPFCPKMFGTVNKQAVQTLDSRSIEIQTFRASKKLESMVGKNQIRDEELTELQKEIDHYITAHGVSLVVLHGSMDVPLKNREEQIIKPLAAIEGYLGLPELVVETYKKTIQNKLMEDLRRNQALVVLRILYQHDGKMSLKELTEKFNKKMQKDRPANYIGGILNKIGLGNFKETRGGGYTYVELPMEEILRHFESYNISKEILDRFTSKGSGDSDALEKKQSEDSEGSEANEPSGAKLDYLLNLISKVESS